MATINTMENSFIRWQNLRITQLSFANNLFIGLAIGLIAYLLNMIKDYNQPLNQLEKFFFWVGGILLLISIGFGIYVVINRLEDFRITTKIARERVKNEKDKKIDIDTLRETSFDLGNNTWQAFIWQVVLFIVGFLNIIGLILINFRDKIF